VTVLVDRWRLVGRLAVRGVAGIASIGAILFGGAGRLDWAAAWAFIAMFSVYLIAGVRGRRRLVLVCCCVFQSVAVMASAQPQGNPDPLPRRGWFGVALAPHESGAVVTSVADGSTAAAEGIRPGDVIRAVDDKPIRTPNDVIAVVSRHVGGESAAIDLIREGQPQRRSVVLRPFPRETMTGHTFEYGAVTLTDGSRLRTILSIPDRRQGRLPAVMLIQGGGCGSVDIPFAADVGQSGVVRTIAARGYITMRVDKSGVADSQGPPCDSIGYSQELDGYRAALAALVRHPSVDPDRVHLLGISLGGMFAPVLAGESRIRSIAVYGTLAVSPSAYPGRSDRFFREFATVDIPASWSAVESRVLVLHGQFDEVAREADHARIAAIVNARHPGRATHRELPGLDHCWTRHETMDKSRGNCGNGEAVSALTDAVLAFLASSSLV
jgi:dienelactone hydrolase